MCRSAFYDKEIDLYNSRLSVSDVEHVSLFLTSCSSQYKRWVEISLNNCYIQDRGLYVIHNSLRGSNITITSLLLNFDDFTQSSSSFISNVVLSCKVDELWIIGNLTIGESEELYTMLSHSSTALKHLHMAGVVLTAKMLFSATKNNKVREELDISHNNIDDDAADDIATALDANTTLDLDSNPISDKAVQKGIEEQQYNYYKNCGFIITV